jgi:hypothetical protein
VPVEVGMRQETRVLDQRTVVGTETRRSSHMTTDHQRSITTDVNSYNVENKVSGYASGAVPYSSGAYVSSLASASNSPLMRPSNSPLMRPVSQSPQRSVAPVLPICSGIPLLFQCILRVKN